MTKSVLVLWPGLEPGMRNQLRPSTASTALCELNTAAYH